MRCCDCEFHKDCPIPENDLVSFQLCETRLKRLIDGGLEEKLAKIAQEDMEDMREKKID